MLDFHVSNGRQVPVFREVLSNGVIGDLVHAVFPKGIRMREVALGLKVTRHAFTVGKLAPIVIGDRIHPILMRGERLGDGVADCLGGLMDDRPHDRVQRLTLDQGHEGAAVALANHGVALPIAEVLVGIDDGGPLINRDPVGNEAAPIMAPVAFAPCLLTAQVAIQVAA